MWLPRWILLSSQIKGLSWEVETGRRDGRISYITEALLNIIPPNANISTLKEDFQQRGLSVKDLIVLSGTQTPCNICAVLLLIWVDTSLEFLTALPSISIFTLYNFTGKGDTDPTLDPNYIIRLKGKCKPGDLNTIVEMDPGSFKTFDEDYYTLVAKRRVSSSQMQLFLMIQKHMSNFKPLLMDMVNMGRIGVLTGNIGEIRKQCSRVN
uniref:peroxidase n=1 Tax=Quercus lobata TaxID=97700 RepID=A0A7N2LUE0_QUELO